MVFAVSLLSCCTLCYFFYQKVKTWMLCFVFTAPILQVSTLACSALKLSLSWSCQISTVCFACATWWLLLSSSCKKSLLLYVAYFNQSLFVACLCFVFTRVKLSKQANHKLLFTHVYFCFQALLLFWCLGFEKKIT